MKKRGLLLFLVSALLTVSLAGCGGIERNAGQTKEGTAGQESREENETAGRGITEKNKTAERDVKEENETEQQEAKKQNGTRMQEAQTGAAEEEDVKDTDGSVSLRFWCDENEIGMFEELIGRFIETYQEEADITVSCEPIGASACKDTFLGDVNNGADVFCIPDDQLLAMVSAGVLEAVPDADKIAGRNLAGAVEAASVEGTLYAYPLTADNGYFLYYDKRYFQEQDVQTLDRILDVCAQNGKKFLMSWTSGWYLYSFFGNTGLSMGVNADGLTNYCNWNTTEGGIKGTEIAQALLDIAGHPGFLDVPDSEFVQAAKDGTAIALVSGVWDAAAIEEAFGGTYGACCLPTYTCAGKQVQMASFQGYRLLGVSAYSGHREWAERLADFLSDEESQDYCFAQGRHGPSNSRAAASDAVRNDPAIAAVLEQSAYAVLQQIGQKYWEPMTEFGSTMAQGNPKGIPLQDLMDQLVSGITET